MAEVRSVTLNLTTKELTFLQKVATDVEAIADALVDEAG